MPECASGRTISGLPTGSDAGRWSGRASRRHSTCISEPALLGNAQVKKRVSSLLRSVAFFLACPKILTLVFSVLKASSLFHTAAYKIFWAFGREKQACCAFFIFAWLRSRRARFSVVSLVFFVVVFVVFVVLLLCFFRVLVWVSSCLLDLFLSAESESRLDQGKT